jgi:uncharacterized RDD family membrane protein YckC
MSGWSRRALALVMMTVMMLAAAAVPLRAQPPEAPPPAERPAEDRGRVGPPSPRDDRFGTDIWRREVFRLGQDYRLAAGESIGSVVAISGTTQLDGYIDDDAVVIVGDVRVGESAVIEHDLIVVGGSVTIARGAKVNHDLVVIAARLDAPGDFFPAGDQIIIAPGVLGGWLDGFFPWLTRGLVWGRLIVPGIPWVWAAVAIFFFFYLTLNLIFGGAVRACADTLAARPLTTFVAGLLTLLLTGPLCLLLTISVVGIAIVPLVLCALLVAWILGKVGVARWIGIRVAGEDDPPSWLQATRSFTIGFILIALAYMVPVIGLITWAVVGTFGLGSAVMAFRGGYRQENPRPPKLEPAPTSESEPLSLPILPAATSAAAQASSMPAAFQNQGAIVSDTLNAAVAPIATDLAVYPHAEFRDRLAAFVLDVILVLILAQWLTMPIWPLNPIFSMGASDLFFPLFIAYRIGFWTWKGVTVGGIICQLRVVKQNGVRLEFADALVRGLSSIFSIVVLGIGCFWVLKDPERQAWHDRIAGTYVVKVPRTYPI